MKVPQGRFGLERIGEDHPSLRPWDAADEYVLGHLAGLEEEAEALGGSWLIANDAFGALAVALATKNPQAWSTGPRTTWTPKNSGLSRAWKILKAPSML